MILRTNTLFNERKKTIILKSGNHKKPTILESIIFSTKTKKEKTITSKVRNHKKNQCKHFIYIQMRFCLILNNDMRTDMKNTISFLPFKMIKKLVTDVFTNLKIS